MLAKIIVRRGYIMRVVKSPPVADDSACEIFIFIYNAVIEFALLGFYVLLRLYK